MLKEDHKYLPGVDDSSGAEKVKAKITLEIQNDDEDADKKVFEKGELKTNICQQ